MGLFYFQKLCKLPVNVAYPKDGSSETTVEISTWMNDYILHRTMYVITYSYQISDHKMNDMLQLIIKRD